MLNSEKKVLITTADGSHSVFIESCNEGYHSRFGALTESQHIYIEAGLHAAIKNKTTLNILEIGFGTGLNALLTMKEATKHGLNLNYHTYEPYPLDKLLYTQLNYPALLEMNISDFHLLHTSPESCTHTLSEYFSFKKVHEHIQEATLESDFYDVVYFDAFAPELDDTIWSLAVFQKIYTAMTFGGVLVTYSCKGAIRRHLKEAGFIVTKIPGPAGKREMSRAHKPYNTL